MKKAVHTIKAEIVLHVATDETNSSVMERRIIDGITDVFDEDKEVFEIFTQFGSVTTTFQE